MRTTTQTLVLLCATASLLAQPAPAADSAGAPAAAPAKPAIKPSELFADSVVAKGKGVEVKRSQLDDAVTSFKANAAGQGNMIPPEQMAMVEPGLLDRLIQVQLLISKATDAEKSKAKDESAKHLQEAKTNAPSEEMFNAQLKAMGMTVDQLVKTMMEQATAEAVLERELKVSVSDADIKKFYDDNPSKFEQPEMVKASHILLMTIDPKTNGELPAADKEAKRKTLEGLLKRARAGEDFGKLAKEFSEDPGSKDKGGEYTFPRGQMVPEFEAAAFSLKTNEISDIVTTKYGYHIIKLAEHVPASKVPLEKISPRIKTYLTQQEIAKLAPEYFARIKKEAGVEILDEKLKLKESPEGVLPPGHPAVSEQPKAQAK